MTKTPDRVTSTPADEPEAPLGRGWIIAGTICALLGLAVGFVMSLGTLR